MLKKKYVKSKDEYEVTFELPSEARDAVLVCEANGWQPVEMKKSKGTFTVNAEVIADKMLANAQEILARSRGG